MKLLPQFRSARQCDDDEEADDCEIECEALKVIDNPRSCAGVKNEKNERVSSRLKKLIQCMQE